MLKKCLKKCLKRATLPPIRYKVSKVSDAGNLRLGVPVNRLLARPENKISATAKQKNERSDLGRTVEPI